MNNNDLLEEQENKINKTYSNIIDLFSKIFYEKGYTMRHHFNNNVWFLNNKNENNKNKNKNFIESIDTNNTYSYKNKFDKNNLETPTETSNFVINQTQTPMGLFAQKNEMQKILEKTSANDSDLENIDVKVEDFILECARNILDYNNQKIKIEENLNKISLRKNLEKIGYKNNLQDWEKEKQKEFTEKNKKNKKENFKNTIISYYIWKIKGLKEGKYEIIFVYKLKGNDFHYNISKFFEVDKSLNLINPLKIEFTLDNNINIFSEQNIFPIKEYFFELYKNSKKIFETESISFDPIVIQFLEKINNTNSFRTGNKEDFEENGFIKDKNENKNYHSLNYSLEINFDENLAYEVIKKTILYYESLTKGIQNLEFKTNDIVDYFDERLKFELNLILNSKENLIDDNGISPCVSACHDCVIF
jgi:hypothetical protein